MEHYLTSQAKDEGVVDFNRKELIAATFAKKNDTGYLVLFFFSLIHLHALKAPGDTKQYGNFHVKTSAVTHFTYLNACTVDLSMTKYNV